MKKLLAFVFLSVSFLVVSCSDDSTSSNGGNNGVDSNYFPLAVGNFWLYKTPDSTATRHVTGTATVNGKSYFKVHDYSDSSDLLLRKSGSILYSLMPVDLTGTLKEVIVVNEKVDSKWSYDIITFDTTHFSFETKANGLTRTTNGNTYNDVLHIEMKTSGTIFGFPFETQSDLYYSKNVGEIERKDDDGGGEMLRTYHVQ